MWQFSLLETSKRLSEEELRICRQVDKAFIHHLHSPLSHGTKQVHNDESRNEGCHENPLCLWRVDRISHSINRISTFVMKQQADGLPCIECCP